MNSTTSLLPWTPLTAHLTGESHMLADGTLWSHAAALGSYIKGFAFTLGESEIANMVRVFSSGYPRKAPVDYEHDAFLPHEQRPTSTPWKLKAGTVIELRAVMSEADMNDAMRAQVASETARRTKLGITEPVEFRGLWVRWEPTDNALLLVKKREVTEMSITFHPNYPHNVSGEGQGPTFLGVALTNTPFLDGMIPVAAARRDGGNPAAPGEETEMSKPTILTRLAAVLGVAPASDEAAAEAAAERITALNSEVATLKAHETYSTMLSAELGESDPGKALAAVRALKASVATATTAAEAARKSAIAATVESTVKEHEARIGSVAARKHFAAALTRELEAGTELEKTETLAVLKSLSPATNLGQNTGADTGESASGDLGSRVAARADALLTENEKLKTLAATDRPAAYKQAVVIAHRELAAK